MVDMPKDQLKDTISHEPGREWPDKIEIIARVGNDAKSVVITKDHFFGEGDHGAPISGQFLIMTIDQLRKWKP